MNNKLNNILIKLTPRFIRKINRIEETTNNIFNNMTRNMIDIDNNIYFTNNYEYWRAKRIVAIVEYYGEKFFQGKKILELGCGHGDIGRVLISLGADVVFCEGREMHIQVLKKRFPNNRIHKANLENEWPFKNERFDIILHMGLLYHLDNFEFSLSKSLESCDYFILETLVVDSDDPNLIDVANENTDGYDQSISGIGKRPSAALLENFIDKYNFNFDMVKDSRCNALTYVYDWKVNNTNKTIKGHRRFWFCNKK
ncbi:class I SAM-dependent methyltransferase [Brachyspira intermedia]|uniref:class I SAM-dependent methyltransferase n=1 Tax=Brachyspira intermedia TaxID=84377 RepID=UPI003006BE28